MQKYIIYLGNAGRYGLRKIFIDAIDSLKDDVFFYTFTSPGVLTPELLNLIAWGVVQNYWRDATADVWIECRCLTNNTNKIEKLGGENPLVAQVYKQAGFPETLPLESALIVLNERLNSAANVIAGLEREVNRLASVEAELAELKALNEQRWNRIRGLFS